MTHFVPHNSTLYQPKIVPQKTIRDQTQVVSREDWPWDKLLYDILSVAVGTGSAYGKGPIKEDLMMPFFDELDVDKGRDAVGNVIINVGTAGKDHNIIFSSHLDTMQNPRDGEIIELSMIKNVPSDTYGIVFANKSGINANGENYCEPSVLGADDKLGVYAMITMIKAEVPGRYIFHVGEECGGVGSSHILLHSPNTFKDINHAVAFDRMYYSDVITRQSTGECCSQEFAKALCDALNLEIPPRVQFSPSNKGMFTDTAHYVGNVSECTNVSVGYFNQHTVNEHFDGYWFMEMFMPALMNVQWDKLPAVREKTVSFTADKAIATQKKYNPKADDGSISVEKRVLVTTKVSGKKTHRITKTFTKENVWKPSFGFVSGKSIKDMQVLVHSWIINNGLPATANTMANLFDRLQGVCITYKHPEWKTEVMRRADLVSDMLTAYSDIPDDLKSRVSSRVTVLDKKFTDTYLSLTSDKECSQFRLDALDDCLSELTFIMMIIPDKTAHLMESIQDSSEYIWSNKA